MTMRLPKRPWALLILWIAGAALPAWAAARSEAKPFAAIVSVTGTATVVRTNGTEERAVTGQLLFRGDVLRTSPEARLQLALHDGTGYEIEGQQTVPMPPPRRSGLRQLSTRAWQALVAKFRALGGSPTAQSVLAGTREGLGEAALRPVQPAPTEGPERTLQRSKVIPERPVFLWTRMGEATRYHLCVQRRDGEGTWERVIDSEALPETSPLVVATPTDLPLEAGGIYRWYVWAEGPQKSERSSWASFQVATAQEAQEVRSTLEHLRALPEKALPLDEEVLRGILYENRGFFADALWAYHRAWMKRPEDRGLQALIADLQERSE
jgi:hypothetical protein